MKNQNLSVRKLARCGMVAALYVVLCMALQPFSYGAVQVRVAEALCLLPVFGAEYIFGVVLGCQEDADRFSIAKTLLSKGFGSYQVTTPAFSGEFLKPLQVLHGTDTAVEVEAQGLTGITVPKGNAGLQTVLVLPEYVEAPVSKGQQLGTAAFYQGDIYLYEVPLTAASSVPRLTFSRAFLRLLDNMLK